MWIMRTVYSLADIGGLQQTYAAERLPSLYHFSFRLDTILLVWNWWQYILPKCQCQSTNLQSIKTQKTDFKSQSLHHWIIPCQIRTLTINLHRFTWTFQKCGVLWMSICIPVFRCAKVAAFNGCRIGCFRRRELKVCWVANYIPFSLMYILGLLLEEEF
jgi:hypothetical protein